MSIAANGESLAVADVWHNPTDIRLDRAAQGWIRLLVWNLPSSKLVHASDNLDRQYTLGGLPTGMGGTALVRISASGDRMAVGGERISVYSFETVSTPPGKS
jgi:hypothetical protein